jgi:hypothetical protein
LIEHPDLLAKGIFGMSGYQWVSVRANTLGMQMSFTSECLTLGPSGGWNVPKNTAKITDDS